MIEEAGTIRNLGLVGASVIAGVGAQPVGALAGENDGNVVNSFATGSVTSAGGHAGGLIGDNFGVVANSFTTGSVTSASGDAGGLVGDNFGGIQNSYATGAVSSTGNGGSAGGLVGTNTSIVTEIARGVSQTATPLERFQARAPRAP